MPITTSRYEYGQLHHYSVGHDIHELEAVVSELDTFITLNKDKLADLGMLHGLMDSISDGRGLLSKFQPESEAA